MFSRLTDSEDIGDHVRDVLDQLRPIKDRVASLKEAKAPVISCAVYFRDYAQPQVRLKKAMLKEMTEMGIEFDFDLYVHELAAP